MKRWMMLLAMLLLIVPCHAQDVDPAKRAKVEELMTTMRVDKMMNQMMDMVKSQVAQTTASLPSSQTMTPKQKEIAAAFQTKALDVAMSTVSFQSMEPEIVKLYANTFTMQELEGILAFYKSPIGQSMLDKQPQLMRGMMTFMQGRIAELQPKMKALTDQFQKDMAAAGPTPKK
ncbi:MAG: DUF2059 domain-containing protein [Bryocella sp.]